MSSMQSIAVITRPTMGIITESFMLLIKENTSLFQPIGVCPTSVAIVPTLSLMSMNISSGLFGYLRLEAF